MGCRGACMEKEICKQRITGIRPVRPRRFCEMTELFIIWKKVLNSKISTDTDSIDAFIALGPYTKAPAE
jgi:hypothetical protein